MDGNVLTIHTKEFREVGRRQRGAPRDAATRATRADDKAASAVSTSTCWMTQISPQEGAPPALVEVTVA